MPEYDDERYLNWVEEFQALVMEFLHTDGNNLESLTDEFENAVENAADEA